jgi:hypothetical protein
MVSCGFTDGGMTQTRQQNVANETTGISGGGWNSSTYDAAGNIVSGPKAGAETTRLLRL